MSLFLRKTGLEPLDGGHGTGLKRTLGALDLTFLGIGAIIGAGLFSSIKDMIVGTTAASGAQMMGAGPAVMVSYALTALACGFAALCYAEISAMVPNAGSAYSYSYAAFGELIAWIIGWDLIIEYAIGNVYVAQSWGDYFQSFLHGLNGDWTLPVWLTKDFQTATKIVTDAGALLVGSAATIADATASAVDQQAALASQQAAQATLDAWASAPRIGDWVVSINLPAAGITIALTVLLFLGIRESTRVNAVMVVLKLGLVAAFIGLGALTIWRRGENHWTPFAPNGFTGIWHGAALGFFSYIGFDAVSTAGEECKNPQRDLPRGLIASLLICTVLYVLTAAVLTGVVPYESIVTNDPLAQAMEAMGYRNFATIFAFGAVVAMTAVLLVFQLGQTRIFMVMSRDGLLPKVFSKVHPRFQTPHVSTWVTGLVVALACSVLTPSQAIGMCNIGTLFAFALVALGVIVLRIREPDRPRPFRVPLYPLVPILAILACLALILGLERSNYLRLVLWLGAGLLVYSLYGYWNSRVRRASGRSPTFRPMVYLWIGILAAVIGVYVIRYVSASI